MHHLVKNEAIIDDYILYLSTEKGAREPTIRAYHTDLKHLFTYFETKSLLEVTEDDVREYKRSISNKAPRTINRKITVIRNFYQYLVDKESVSIYKNPVGNILKVKVPKKIPIILSDQQADSLLDYILLHGTYGIRDYAIFCTFLLTGCRVSELIKLKIQDINFDESYIHFRDAKGAKDRIVPMLPRLSEAIKIYLNTPTMFVKSKKGTGYTKKIDAYRSGREYFVTEESDTLFLTKFGGHFSDKGIAYLFKSYAKQLGFYKSGLSIHALRRSCLTYLHKEGVDIYTIREISGHSDIKTLEHYLSIDRQEVLKEMKKHPLSKGGINPTLLDVFRKN